MDGLEMLTQEQVADERLIDCIKEGLAPTLPGDVADYAPRPLTIRLKAKQSDVVIGALVGQSVWNWLYINLLWVDQAQQSRGLGRRLMHAAEIEAEARGCIGIWVSTYSFQAPAFYEKLGYAPFGRIDDFPNGHIRYFYQKRLSRQ